MAKLTVVLYTSKKYKDGTSPIMLRLTKNKLLKYYKIGDELFKTTDINWDKKAQQVLVKKKTKENRHVFTKDEAEKINTYLTGKLIQAKKILHEFEEKGTAWTLNMFDEEYRKKPQITQVKAFIIKKVNTLNIRGKYNSARNLTETLHLLEQFRHDFHKLYFQDVDYKFVEDFYFYLKNERQNKDTSIGFALRAIRTILNDAISQGVGSKDTYPFSKLYGAKRIFKISKLEKRTNKRFIPKEYLIKILETEFIEPHLNWAKNVFLFSFFSSGINFKDMAFLTSKNIRKSFTQEGKQQKYIEFTRQKTGEVINIPVTTQVDNLLKWFLKINSSSKYLIPIVTIEELEGEKLNNHIVTRRKRFNKHLRTIAKKLEFPEGLENISSYHARHSYATTMLRNGAQIEKISEALGHSNIKTTQTYLGSFGLGELTKLNENLL